MRSENRKSINEKRRVALIFLAISFIAIFTLVNIFSLSFEEGQFLRKDNGLEDEKDNLANTSGTWDAILAEKQVAGGQRDLKSFHNRRAYPGAPPVIPHETTNDNHSIPGDCLACHENGGFSPKFKAYTPKTPHPEYINCKQCHVPQGTSFFRQTKFTPRSQLPINQKGLRSSPPVIPHELSLRENCASCHTGPGAVKEIRSTHPERVNCVQCHVPQHLGPQQIFKRETP